MTGVVVGGIMFDPVTGVTFRYDGVGWVTIERSISKAGVFDLVTSLLVKNGLDLKAASPVVGFAGNYYDIFDLGTKQLVGQLVGKLELCDSSPYYSFVAFSEEMEGRIKKVNVEIRLSGGNTIPCYLVIEKDGGVSNG